MKKLLIIIMFFCVWCMGSGNDQRLIDYLNKPTPFSRCVGADKYKNEFRSCVQKHFPQCLKRYDKYSSRPFLWYQCTMKAIPVNVTNEQKETRKQWEDYQKGKRAGNSGRTVQNRPND